MNITRNMIIEFTVTLTAVELTALDADGLAMEALQHHGRVPYGGGDRCAIFHCYTEERANQIENELRTMTIKIEDRDTAARHLDAIEVTPDVWVYLPAEVSEHYTVTSDDLATLGRDLRLDTPDAYSLWCTVCGRESDDDEIAAHFYLQSPWSRRSTPNEPRDRGD